jgi:hypothetical protein
MNYNRSLSFLKLLKIFLLPYFILSENQCDDIFQYIFTNNHHKSIKKKCQCAGWEKSNKSIFYFFKMNTNISTSFRRSILISFWIDMTSICTCTLSMSKQTMNSKLVCMRYIIWKYFGKWCEAKCLTCNDFS